MLIDKQGLLMQQYVGTKYLMNKYLVTVRLGGQLVKTAVFANSTIHARLLCQYKYGMNSIAVSPVRVDEAEDDSTLLDNTIKPKPPTTPAQARINSLKQGVERSRDQLHAERERQRQQREAERKRKQQQQRF
ncbi:hypothetical protein [Limnohabitans sp. 2KL-51]|uniref:hypothetical protein n=1 Tax=Limnohabitans sp. 2KL-51 TaxID=1977911 RepID=UPI001E5A1AF9|nr:hypothetical protein [Limnohabitans sp. 2KL-51]